MTYDAALGGWPRKIRGALTYPDRLDYEVIPMQTIRATFEFDVPDGVTEAEINDWLAFELHAICQLPAANPLSNAELEATDILSVRAV